MRLFILVQIFIVLFIFGCETKQSLLIDNLCCENLKNPLGVNSNTPRFSWEIKSDRNGTEQKAFQLQVASGIDKLKKNNTDLWDSGKVESSSSIWVTYKGNKLRSGAVGYWKVRVWDESGHVSPWSTISHFSIGLLSETDWQASYIGLPSEAGFNDCPQLKKSFKLKTIGERTLLHVNSLGYHEVFMNEQKIDKSVLSPAVSQFKKRSLIVTYDVSSYVKKGNNELMLWLGSGWYNKKSSGDKNTGSLVKAQLEQLTDNQREIILKTDSSWLGRSSEYTRIGRWRSGNYGGEEINGVLKADNIFSEKEVENSWTPVTEQVVKNHKVSPQMAEQNMITTTINPVSIKRLSPESFLIDMGKNLTGWFEIHFQKLQKHQKVTIEYCDHLDKNAQFVDQKQTDRYIASGEGLESFINKFNYHGFRYVKVSNLAEEPNLKSVKAHLIRTGFKAASTFQCSDPELNDIHNMLQYTLQCLSLGGYIVDCPQFERLGYGGDGNASTITAQTMFDLLPLYRNWLQAWADCMRPNGDLPHTAPSPIDAGGGPYWCGFIITATWETYLNYGDKLLLQDYYPHMQKWLGFVENNMVDGLLKKWPDTDYRGWYLGDWASPDGVDQTAEASVDVVTNSFVTVCYDCMEEIAKVLGEEFDVGLYSRKRDLLKSKIHRSFFDSSKNSYATGSQIDLAYPLLANIVPDTLKERVINTLENVIINKHNGHFACGLVGIPVFTEWAIENQAADLMYSMLKKKDYPGYLYMIDKGATTTWEHWNGNRSRIHNCYNGIGSWFYQALGGIRLAENVPAYQKVIIEPQIPEGITWAKTSKETPYGKLNVNWEIIEGTMAIELEIPVGVEAKFVIPQNVNRYTLDGENYKIADKKGLSVKLGSGKYTVAYNKM